MKGACESQSPDKESKRSRPDRCGKVPVTDDPGVKFDLGDNAIIPGSNPADRLHALGEFEDVPAVCEPASASHPVRQTDGQNQERLDADSHQNKDGSN